MKIHPLWEPYPVLNEELFSVLSLMDSHIRVRDKAVEKTIKEMIFSGGKMLRPAFSLLCSHIGMDQDRKRSVAVAAALEILHMATIVHDDVIDEAETRRGVETIHSKHGNHLAVYTGDYLFCVCFNILSSHATSLSHLEFNSRSMEKILSGELKQMNSRFQEKVSIRKYLSRIAGKTAQLFAVSCYSGAIESGASRNLAMKAWNMGHNIGMAFQIIDDILDYKGDSKVVGKPVMKDARQGLYTLPLIYAMQGNEKEFHLILQKKQAMTCSDMEKLLSLIEQYNGVQKAEQLAQKYTNKALDQLSKLPDGDYKTILREVITLILRRGM